ncbi:MAG: nuclear transport factor 2 family protein [Pseudomonadota bacterium]
MTLKPRRLLSGLICAGLLSACSANGDAHSERSNLRADVKQGQDTLQTAEAFLTAAGTGDMSTLQGLMADDFVWHNEGDDTLPWIGTWEGKETVLTEFLPAFGAGLTTTSWTTDYAMAMGDQAVFIGTMSATANASGGETGEFSWAVRVHVEDGLVKSWNWFEDSFAVSEAYHAAD